LDAQLSALGVTGLFGSVKGDGNQDGKSTFDSSGADSAVLTEALQTNTQEQAGGQMASPRTNTTIELPTVEPKTGEEAEERLLQVKDAKLFVFRKEDGDGKWKEAGRGTLNVNRNPDTSQVRLVMRRNETKQLILNAALWQGMPYKFVGGKDVRISCSGLESSDIKQHLIRVMGEPCIPKTLDAIISKHISVEEKIEPTPQEANANYDIRCES